MLDPVLHSLILTKINRSLLSFTRAAFDHLFSEASSIVIPKKVFSNNGVVNTAKRTIQMKYCVVCYNYVWEVFLFGWLDFF